MNRSTYNELSSRVGAYWEALTKGARESHAAIKISVDHTNAPVAPSGFIPADSYINVYLSEMWLTNERQLWRGVEPMVLAVTELLYQDANESHAEMQCIPLVVGPGLLSGLSSVELPSPKGIAFLNTPVVGPIPYLGGRVALTIILYRVPIDGDGAQKLLKVLETISGLLSYVPALSTFLTVSGPLITGLDLLLGGGKPKILAGKRTIYDDASLPLEPGYHVLFNASTHDIDPNKLWVREGRLYEGDSLNRAVNFTRCDFVMFCIMPSVTRTDDSSLSFYALFKRALDLAYSDLEVAAITMQSLVQALRASPELTRTDKRRLINEYAKEYAEVVLEYRAFLLQIEATLEWKQLQLDEAVAKGRIGSSKSVTNTGALSPNEQTWGEIVLKGLDPRFA